MGDELLERAELLELELAQARLQLEIRGDELTRLRQRLADSERRSARAEGLELEVARARREAEGKERDRDRLSVRLLESQTAAARLGELQRDLAQREEQVRELARREDKQRLRLLDLEGRAARNDVLLVRLDELSAEGQAGQRELEQLRLRFYEVQEQAALDATGRGRADELQSRLDDARDSLLQLRADLEERRTRVQALEEKLEQQQRLALQSELSLASSQASETAVRQVLQAREERLGRVETELRQATDQGAESERELLLARERSRQQAERLEERAEHAEQAERLAAELTDRERQLAAQQQLNGWITRRLETVEAGAARAEVLALRLLDLEGDLRLSRSEVERERADLVALRERYREAEGARTLAAQQAGLLEQSLARAERRLETVEAQLELARAGAQDKGAALDELRVRMTTAEALAGSRDQELERLTAALEEARGGLGRWRETAAGLEEKLSQVQAADQVRALSDDLRAARLEIERYRGTAELLTEEAQGRREALRLLEETRRRAQAMEGELATSRTQAGSSAAQLEELRVEMRRTSQRLLDREARLESLNQARDSLEAASSRLGQELADSLAEIESLGSSLREQTGLREMFEQRLQDAFTDLQRSVDRFRHSESLLEEARGQAEQASAGRAEAEEALRAALAELAVSRDKFEEQERQLETARQQSAERGEASIEGQPDRGEQLRVLAGYYEQARQSVSHLKGQLQERSRELEETRGQLAEAQEQLQGKSWQVMALQSHCDRLLLSLRQAEEEQAALRQANPAGAILSDLASEANASGQSQLEIEALERRILELGIELRSSQQAREHLQSALAEMEGALEAQEPADAEPTDSEGDMETRLRVAESRARAMKLALADRERRLAAVRDQLAEREGLGQRLALAEQEVERLQATLEVAWDAAESAQSLIEEGEQARGAALESPEEEPELAWSWQGRSESSTETAPSFRPWRGGF